MELRCMILIFGLLLSLLSHVPHALAQGNPDPKIIEGARKEGQMIFYTTMTLDQSKVVVDRFQKKFPFIKPTLFRTGGGPLLNKRVVENPEDYKDLEGLVKLYNEIFKLR
jgi:hypothetical protein